MKRTRLKTSGKVQSKTRLHSSYHHPKFKTQLKHFVSKLARETGHPFEVLEQKFMSNFHKMPLNKQYAVSQGVGMGGMYASAIVVGTVFGSPVLGALGGIPMVLVTEGKDISARRQMKKMFKDIDD